MSSRTIIVFIALMVAWLGLWARGAYLQIFPSPKLARLERRQFETRIEINGRRGLIVDRSGRELAATIPSWSVFADPSILERPKAAAATLARILKLPKRTLTKKLMARRRFVWIGRHITEGQASSIRRLDWRGISVIEEPRRVYPNGKLLSQVLGFVGQEGHGLEGLERHYNTQLVGERRQVVVPRDARGRPLLSDGVALTQVRDGAKIELTIDGELQFTLEQELMRVIQEQRADGALGVILDPDSGEILAMASEPGFDLAEVFSTPPQFRRIRAITDSFEPGSTMKAFVVAAALRSGRVRPSTRIDCEGGRFKIGNRWIREADEKHAFRELTVAEILAYSSNVGTSKIALLMGPEKLREALTDFGFGSTLGVDLPGESRGILQPLPWRPHLLSTISFGHGIAATPLQLAAGYAALANGGWLRTPRLLRRVVSADSLSNVELTVPSQEIRRVLTDEQSATMRLLLRAATMEQATGEKARIPGFPVAGKTGTAQKVDFDKRGYVKGAYISSFAGFVPANSPKFVIYIAVDNPRKDYYASSVAAPVFARMAQFAVQRAGLSPVLLSDGQKLDQRGQDSKLQQMQSAALKENRKLIEAQNASVVPELSGLPLREALRHLKGQKIAIDVQGRGTVARTWPAAGESWTESRRLMIYLEKESGEIR